MRGVKGWKSAWDPAWPAMPGDGNPFDSVSDGMDEAFWPAASAQAQAAVDVLDVICRLPKAEEEPSFSARAVEAAPTPVYDAPTPWPLTPEHPPLPWLDRSGDRWGWYW